MSAKFSQGTIREIETVHRKNLSTFDGYKRYARIVVWAITCKGKRVWVRTVEGGLDPVDVGVKIAMTQEFFAGLVGHRIRFCNDGGTFFVEENSLPKKFLVSYQEIKEAMQKWVEVNCAEKLEQLRIKKSAKMASTRKANAEAKEVERKRRATRFGLPDDATLEVIRQAEKEWWEQERLRTEEVLRQAKEKRLVEWRKKMEALIAGGDSKYLKATFTLGQHRQTGEGQFEFQKDGKLYVLRRQDSHIKPEGEQYVSIDRELVPGRIYLVRKEHCY